MSALARLAPAAVAATYFLIVVGAVVRVTGSGMGCLDDWPLCQGQLLPPAEFTAIVEWTHRLIGAIVSPLILTVCVVALLRARQVAALRWPALLVPLLLVTQIVLGAIVVRLELAAMVVMVHLGFAMVIFGLLAWMAVWSQRAPSVLPARDGEPSEPVVPRSVVRLIWVTTLLAFVLVISGALVRATGATWACVGFPTCNGEALPFGTSTLVDIHLLHRLLAYSVAWLVGLTVYQVGKRARRAPALFRTAVHAGGFVLLQVAFGAIAVTFGVTPVIQALHVAGASAVWGSMVVLAALVTRVQNATTNAASTQNLAETRSSGRDVAMAYFQLTKPRVMVLLLITTLASMMVAAGGMPALPLVFFTLLGGALAAGGAGAINHYLDRDIDLLMGRTALRPIPAGAVDARRALAFGIALGVLSFVLMTVYVNLLSAVLSLGALLFYVFVYTRWLKRISPSNIVIGGAAGAVPPLVGVAAVTGEINLLALYLFAIVFFWTPPHFWALALVMRREYERANIPMLPVVRGEQEARKQILFYSLQMVALTALLFAFQLMGFVYLVAALLLGGLFIYYAVRLWREASTVAARRLFKYSIVYLTLLFAAMVVDKQIVL